MTTRRKSTMLNGSAVPKTRSSVLDDARAFGANQHRTSVLADFAVHVAGLVAKGEVDASDANALYEAYALAAQRVTSMDPRSSTFKVQASKLRQVIKLAEQLGPQAVALLAEVRGTHRALYDAGRTSETAYHAMVRVSRHLVLTHARKAPSSSALKKLLTK